MLRQILFCSIVFLCPAIPAAVADTIPVRPIGITADFSLDSGARINAGSAFETVFAQEIAIPQAAWLRLYFGDVRLEGASFIRMSALHDGEQQSLSAGGLAQWSYGSAYFNGDAVLLELVAAPGTANRITLTRLAYEETPGDAGTRGDPGICGICSADDRTPSNEDWACRLMPIGCSASVYSTQSCLVSAGHCAQDGLVAQFRVPASLPDCSVVQPPVSDQFPVLGFDAQATAVGADWSVMTTGTNDLGQTAFERYGQLRRIAPVLATAGDPVSIAAFAMDTTCTRSRTQQRSTGAIQGRAATYYTFNADAQVGSSGAGVMKDGRIVAVVTHCSPNCPNAGTRVDQANFVAGRNSRCPACVADVNGDGLIDLTDLASLLSAFGRAYPDAAFQPPADLNSDNAVDLSDLAVLLGRFGGVCP